MNKRVMKFAALSLMGLAVIAAAGVAWVRWMITPPPAVNPVVAGTGPSVTLMDFAKPIALDPPPPGWWHLKFITKPPMSISFVEKSGVPALRCETSASGSIFGRHTDIDLAQFPYLSWSWLVEIPVVAATPETTGAGDDHPARFLMKFADGENAEHDMEIIWSNGAFKAGQWKYIGGFPHFVANGGNARTGENTNVWFKERVNLLDLYRSASKRTDNPRLKYISIFCDTDDTGAKSVAYFSGAELRR
jgi:Protein of unknown function (DUF3047)